MIINEMEIIFIEETVHDSLLTCDLEGKTGRFFLTMVRTPGNSYEVEEKLTLFHFKVFGAYFCSTTKKAWIKGAMLCYSDDKDVVTGFILGNILQTRCLNPRIDGEIYNCFTRQYSLIRNLPMFMKDKWTNPRITYSQEIKDDMIYKRQLMLEVGRWIRDPVKDKDIPIETRDPTWARAGKLNTSRFRAETIQNCYYDETKASKPPTDNNKQTDESNDNTKQTDEFNDNTKQTDEFNDNTKQIDESNDNTKQIDESNDNTKQTDESNDNSKQSEGGKSLRIRVTRGGNAVDKDKGYQKHGTRTPKIDPKTPDSGTNGIASLDARPRGKKLIPEPGTSCMISWYFILCFFIQNRCIKWKKKSFQSCALIMGSLIMALRLNF